MLFTLKLARLLPNDRNRPDVLLKRTEYAEWLINHAILRNRVFIDACGCDVWTARCNGRARVDKMAYQQVCRQREQNVTDCLAVSENSGSLFHTALLGGKNRDRFTDCLTQTRLYLDHDWKVIFIFDGAPAHTNPPVPISFERFLSPSFPKCRAGKYQYNNCSKMREMISLYANIHSPRLKQRGYSDLSSGEASPTI